MMWHLMEIMRQHGIHSSVVVQADAVWGFFLIILLLTFPGTAIACWYFALPWDAIWQKLSVVLEIMFKHRHHRCQLVYSGIKMLIHGASQILRILHHGLHRRTLSLKYWKLCDLVGDYMLKSSWSTWLMCVQESSKLA